MGGGGQGWTDWARPTQTQEVPPLCGKCFIITAKALCLSHRAPLLKDPPLPPSVHGVVKNIISADIHSDRSRALLHICLHIPLWPCSLWVYLENSKHLFEQRGWKPTLQAREASRNIRKTQESLWRGANTTSHVLQQSSKEWGQHTQTSSSEAGCATGSSASFQRCRPKAVPADGFLSYLASVKMWIKIFSSTIFMCSCFEQRGAKQQRHPEFRMWVPKHALPFF